MAEYWHYDGLKPVKHKKKLKRFVKGSKEAKAYMHRIKTFRRRRATYKNGLTHRKR